MAYEVFKIEHQQDGEHLDTYQTIENTRGRIETRRLTCSTILNEYLDWPGVQQVFEYTTQRKNIATGEVETYKQYGITSLSPARATAADLLTYKRGHWTIENQSHWIRDVVSVRMPLKSGVLTYPPLWQSYETRLLRSCGSQDIHTSAKQRDISQQNLNKR